jgi:hypothetical protein
MEHSETHEIAIEKRQRGALSATEAAALDAHLPHCTACQDYLRACQQMERVMTVTTQDTPRFAVRRPSSGPSMQRLLLWTGLLMLVLLSGVGAMWPLLLIAGVYYYWVTQHGAARDPLATPAQRLERELIASQRARLDAQIRLARLGSWALVGYGVLSVMTASGMLLMMKHLFKGMPAMPFDMTLLTGAMVGVQLVSLAGLFVYVRRGILPPLELQRRRLS